MSTLLCILKITLITAQSQRVDFATDTVIDLVHEDGQGWTASTTDEDVIWTGHSSNPRCDTGCIIIEGGHYGDHSWNI